MINYYIENNIILYKLYFLCHQWFPSIINFLNAYKYRCYLYNVLVMYCNNQPLSFHRFYSKREGRKTLKLLPQFGTVELDAIFYDVPKSNKRSCDGEYSTTNNQCCVERKYRVMVTTYQMCVLDMFNTYDFLTYEVIY